jgi:hypothetical protein
MNIIGSEFEDRIQPSLAGHSHYSGQRRDPRHIYWRLKYTNKKAICVTFQFPPRTLIICSAHGVLPGALRVPPRPAATGRGTFTNLAANSFGSQAVCILNRSLVLRPHLAMGLPIRGLIDQSCVYKQRFFLSYRIVTPSIKILHYLEK